MWTDIECGILEMIISLLNLAGVACVASVCTRWRDIVKSFAIDHRLTARHRSWLVISSRPYNQTVALMNPLRRPINPWSRRFCGAFDDWLVIIDTIDGVYLYHPLLQCVQLPPLNFASNGFDRSTYQTVNHVRKVILSSPPSSAECLVAVVFGYRGLAFCKLGDSRWTNYLSEDQDEMWFWHDAVFYNGRLVALDTREFVWSFGFRSEQIDRQLLFQPAAGQVVDQLGERFLVESMGHLLMVFKRLKVDVEYEPDSTHLRCKMHDFKIFQLGMNGREWTPLETLGKRVMFLTRAMSSVVASDEIGEDFGSDCIYYAEDESSQPDWAFFMADKRLVQLPTHDEVGGRVPLFFSMFTNV